MFMQFTGCHHPVERFYWPENAIDWLRVKKSFSYRGAVSWNSLPSEIVDVHDQLSLSSFKTLINHYYKDLEKNTSTI